MPSRKTIKSNTVVAVFHDRPGAERAIADLRKAGFRDDEIGLVARNEKGEVVTEGRSGETFAEEGAVAGAVAGAGVGGLIGLGIIAGVIPAIGPAIMAGTLGTILSNAAGGAALAGLTGALVGWGIPEEDAAYYESEVKSGRFLVTVNTADRADEAWRILHGHGAYNRAFPAASASARTATGSRSAASRAAGSARVSEGGTTVQLKEEELRVHKTPVKAGEVEVRKEVHTEHKQITVPVEREEVVIERRPAAGSAAAGSVKAEEIRIPVKEERVNVTKETVVKEEVTVGKRKVHDTKTVADTVKKEELKVEETGDVTVKGDRAKSRK